MSEVWTKPEYSAADLAYRQALLTDANDQMSALALAIDAALATHREEAARNARREAFREALDVVGKLQEPLSRDVDAEAIDFAIRLYAAILALGESHD